METITQDQHPTEELLEQYAAGKLPQNAVASISTHLFDCDSCYERYEEEVNLRINIRNAAAAATPEPERVPFWSRIFAIPAPALAGAAAFALLLLLVIPKWTNNDGAPVVAELSAMRGAEPGKPLPAGHPVRLKLNAAGVDASSLRVEVADAGGAAVWTGTAATQNGTVDVTVDRRLRAGSYWVRLYTPTEKEPLREYALTLN